MIDFSPCENYLVTWSHDPISVPSNLPQGPEFFSPEDEGNNIAVWDIKSGQLLRTFPTTAYENEDPAMKKQMQWPALKWSSDDKFVARVTPGQHISVYELPTMGLHDKKSLKIEGVVDFEWCPHGEKDKEDTEKAARADKTEKGAKKRENMLAYWTPEVANQPARVTLISFPSRTVLRQKNLFNVTEAGVVRCFCGWSFIEDRCYSVNFIGKIRVTSSVSRSTVIPRPKNPFSAILRSSEFARRTIPLKLLS